MIDIKNLSCGYGSVDVIKNIDLFIRDGERLCILGPNGCGKSTLIKTICGIISYKGSLKLDDKEIKSYKRSELSGKIAVLSQVQSIFFSYTVYDTVAMGRYAKSKGLFYDKAAERKTVTKWIDKLGLGDISDKPVTELSGGQLQRTLLARAFAQEPKIILLDEPTNHLDISYQIELCELISDWLAEDKSRTVIGVIHELNLIPRLFERTVLMDNGRIYKSGDTASVLKSQALAEVYKADVCGFMRDTGQFWLDNERK